MVALTADRNTPARGGDTREPGVAANAVIHAGAMIGLNASGFAVPMATAAGLKAIGRAERAVDNTGGANGARRIPARAGVFRYANSTAADAITLGDIGADCYAVDDQTVAKTSGSSTRSVAGTVFDVDDLGVWVKFS